jgi:uncharacterized protein YndB with AHSA1/START domain/DNA-binding transcriptional ArsR family regulator
MTEADHLSSIFAALADPTRRAILERLAGGEATVNELAEPFAISLPAISRHLKVLEQAGLISRGRTAQWRPCRLETGPLEEAVDWITKYRTFYEARFDRLEAHLRELQKQAEGREGAAWPRSQRSVLTERHQGRKDAQWQTGEPIIVITRELDAPRDLVWRAWTDPAHVAAWYAPEGFTVPRIELDFRPGGVMELDMQGPDGTIYPNKGTYREIVPPERIVISDEVQESDAWGDEPPADNVQTVTFEALPGNRTRIRNVIRLNSVAARDAMVEMGAATGWKETLDKLVAHLTSMQGR